MIEEALISLLLADANVAAEIGTDIYWVRSPQEISGRPYATLQVVSDPFNYNLCGPQDLRETGIQIDVWADSYSKAKAVSRAILGVLSGYRGQQGGANIQGTYIGGQRDLPDETTGQESQLFRVSVDVNISWNEV